MSDGSWWVDEKAPAEQIRVAMHHDPMRGRGHSIVGRRVVRCLLPGSGEVLVLMLQQFATYP